MFDLIHLRAKLDKLKQAVAQVYTEKEKKLEGGVIDFFGAKKAITAQLTNLDELRSKLDEVEKLASLIDCPQIITIMKSSRFAILLLLERETLQ